jgi:hypothetical protein
MANFTRKNAAENRERLKKLKENVSKKLKSRKAKSKAAKEKKDEGKGLKNWYPGKYVKKLIKGKKGKKEASSDAKKLDVTDIVKNVSKANKAKADAKKAKADASWKKATAARKKSGGKSMNELIKARNKAKAEGNKAAYADAQNAINEAYGVSKRHKASKKTDKPKKMVVTKEAITESMKGKKKSDMLGPVEKPSNPPLLSDKAKDKLKKGIIGDAISKELKQREELGAMRDGGKVESNPYGWPSSDARKR